MAERKESSVLFSLRELKEIEEDRQREEAEALRRAEAERLRLAAEAEARARAEEQARIAAKETAEREERARLERQAREERLQIEAAERDARMKAQAVLEQQRLAKQMEIDAIVARKKRPVALKIVAGLLVTGVLSLGGFLFFQKRQSDARERAYQADLLAMREEIASKEADYDRLLTQEDQQFAQLIAAKNDAEKAELERRWKENQRQLEIQAANLADLRKREAEKRQRDAIRAEQERERKKKVDVKCDPNDPLCGI